MNALDVPARIAADGQIRAYCARCSEIHVYATDQEHLVNPCAPDVLTHAIGFTLRLVDARTDAELASIAIVDWLNAAGWRESRDRTNWRHPAFGRLNVLAAALTQLRLEDLQLYQLRGPVHPC